MTEQTEKKIVWIKCRAHSNPDACPGNQAEVVFDRAVNPVSNDGGFEPSAGGRSVRYRCISCKRVFHIST